MSRASEELKSVCLSYLAQEGWQALCEELESTTLYKVNRSFRWTVQRLARLFEEPPDA